MSTMEALNPEWPPLLQSILNIREEMSREESRGRMAEYTEQEDEIELEQMLVYFLYVYCCTSAYDEQLLAKCKMAVVNVLIIRELWFMRWMEMMNCLRSMIKQSWRTGMFARLKIRMKIWNNGTV